MGLRGDPILRNLDKENPLFARPQSVAPIGAVLPFILGGMCALLASEATPHIPISGNPLALFCICLSVASLISALMPKIFGWDWRTKYFGFSTVYLASASLLGVIPLLCIVLYSSLPLWARLSLLCGYAGTIILWCRRFVLFYRRVCSNKVLRDILYVEDIDAVYYSQKNDNWLIEKKFKLKQFPSNIVILISLGLAFILVPFIHAVKDIVGLPFPHMFLTVGSFPVIMAVLGLAMRGYLVFYYYPWKIKKETGKEVYVDMVTKTASLKN
jgi:hypothetical protein